MANYTISGNKIGDENALAGLQNISENERFRKLHNGDTNFTESEMGAILDIYDSEEGVIDGGDQVTHTIIEETGLTDAQFIALAKEYHTRFPQGKRKVDSGLWAPRQNVTVPNLASAPSFDTQLITMPTLNESSIELSKTRFDKSAQLYCQETATAPPIIHSRSVKNSSEVVLISGPGGTAFDQKFVERLSTNLSTQKGVAAFTVVGNGNSAVDISETRAVIRRAREEGRPVTLFIHMHGDVQSGKHYIMTANDKWTPTAELFQIIKQEAGDSIPVSIFMTSCHGGAAISETNPQLPEGISLVVLSSSTETVAGGDVEKLANVLGNNSADLNDDQWPEDIEMLYLYLTKALENRIAPEIALAGKEKLDLEAELNCRIGKSFLTDEKKHIHARLDPLLGKGGVDEIIAKIERKNNGESIMALDFGKALAVILALYDNRT